MPVQTFEYGDIWTCIFLVLLEGLLSADNAVVLATIAKNLPLEFQRKALTYGIAGSLLLRFIAILFASYIIKLWWLQAIGALYLLYLPVKHFFGKKKNLHFDSPAQISPSKSFFFGSP